MALSYYEALYRGGAAAVLDRAYRGIGDYEKYLKACMAGARDRRLCLAWRADPEEADWVELVEPEDRPNEPDKTFDEFMDSDLQEVEAIESRQARRGRKLRVVERDAEPRRLKLSRIPDEEEELLAIPINTYTLHAQIKAIQALQNAPASEHQPLLRLLEREGVAWPALPDEAGGELPQDIDWAFLKDDRAGADEQRLFVRKALATPDFAFLEGPPGSGKTTAICELVAQAVRRGQRVMLVASTHVAVDNVLERIMDERSPSRSEVIPIRIGDSNRISESVKEWQLQNFCATERDRLTKHLASLEAPSEGQSRLLGTLRSAEGSAEITRLVLDCANLVCGTTIGILQHPEIKKTNREPISRFFDFMILDEASKTTFQEFLVPAVHGKRWIIVGDPKQLSPYVEDEDIAFTLDRALGDEVAAEAAMRVSSATKRSDQDGRDAEPLLVLDNDVVFLDACQREAQGRGLIIARMGSVDDSAEMAAAEVVLARPADLSGRIDKLPLDLQWVSVGADCAVPDDLLRRLRVKRKAPVLKSDPEHTWAGEVAWRLARAHEQRDVDPEKDGGFRRKEVENLLPRALDGRRSNDLEAHVDCVRRVALPSILTVLQNGHASWFNGNRGNGSGSPLKSGLPAQALAERHVLLTHQHRMHPEIAAFSREHVYMGEALLDASGVAERRAWEYSRERAAWISAQGDTYDGGRNPLEAARVIEELTRFQNWARSHPRGDGEPWEVAILSYYRGQESQLRDELRKLCRSRSVSRFKLQEAGGMIATVHLCTVDRFQGHEADVVFISLANKRATDFFKSPSRLNVALTRARYLRVIFGSASFFSGRKARKASDDDIFARCVKWHEKRTSLHYGEPNESELCTDSPPCRDAVASRRRDRLPGAPPVGTGCPPAHRRPGRVRHARGDRP